MRAMDRWEGLPEVVHLLHHRRKESWGRGVPGSPPSSAEEERGKYRNGCKDGHDDSRCDFAVGHAMLLGNRDIGKSSGTSTGGRESCR